MRPPVLVRLSIALVAAVVAGSVSSAQSRPETPPRKVLFVGDSFTFAQGGLDNHFAKLAASASPPLVVSAARAVAGGAFLKVLWEMKTPVTAIDTGNFDVVVLQDDIPETNVDYFRQYARLFVEEARTHNARPVLFMAWAYQRLGWISMQEIARAHRDLAKELNVDVAPAGLAWQRSSSERPSLDMLRRRSRASKHLRHLSRHVRHLRHDLRQESFGTGLRALGHLARSGGFPPANRLADGPGLFGCEDLKSERYSKFVMTMTSDPEVPRVTASVCRPVTRRSRSSSNCRTR